MPAALYAEFSLPVNASATGDNTLIPAFPNGILRVWRWNLWIPAATTLIMKNGASTALTGPMQFPANVGWVLDVSSNQWPWYETSAGNAFVMNNSGGAAVAGAIYYTVGN